MDADGKDPLTLSEMRKKITTLQTEKLQLLDDVETGEKMLELQTKINAELQDQLNEMKTERNSGRDVLKSQLRKLRINWRRSRVVSEL